MGIIGHRSDGPASNPKFQEETKKAECLDAEGAFRTNVLEENTYEQQPMPPKPLDPQTHELTHERAHDYKRLVPSFRSERRSKGMNPSCMYAHHHTPPPNTAQTCRLRQPEKPRMAEIPRLYAVVAKHRHHFLSGLLHSEDRQLPSVDRYGDGTNIAKRTAALMYLTTGHACLPRWNTPPGSGSRGPWGDRYIGHKIRPKHLFFQKCKPVFGVTVIHLFPPFLPLLPA